MTKGVALTAAILSVSLAGTRSGASEVPGGTGATVAQVSVVRFFGDGDDVYWIRHGAESCRTPCALLLEPGPQELQVTGPHTDRLTIQVPEASATVHLRMENPRVRTAGIVLTVVGALLSATTWMMIVYPCAAYAEMVNPTDGALGCAPFGFGFGLTLPFPILVSGVALLGHWATHRETTAVVDVDGAPPLKRPAPALVSLRLQPVQRG